jgi:hypothetical protein
MLFMSLLKAMSDSDNDDSDDDRNVVGDIDDDIDSDSEQDAEEADQTVEQEQDADNDSGDDDDELTDEQKARNAVLSKKQTNQIMTTYELARLVGALADYIDTDDEKKLKVPAEIERKAIDFGLSLDLAEYWVIETRLPIPINIIRNLPKGVQEVWNPREMILPVLITRTRELDDYLNMRVRNVH